MLESDITILENWMQDFPQQFQGYRNIECLIQSFARQLEEVQVVFRQLNERTDLETATGKNLDMVGDIIGLTRKDAGILAGASVTEPVISDSRYRQFLRYQQLQNTAEGTYQDVMKSIELLWNTDRIQYGERPERPATLWIETPSVEIDAINDPLQERTPVIKPAGVAVLYKGGYILRIDQSWLEQFRLKNVLLHIYAAVLHNKEHLRIDSQFRQGFITTEEGWLRSIQLAWQIWEELPDTDSEASRRFLRKLHFRFYLNFWEARLLNGSRRLDGSKRLDGRRRYRLLLGIVFGWKGKRIPENFQRPSVKVSWKQPLFGKLEAGRIENRMKIGFWKKESDSLPMAALFRVKINSSRQEEIGSMTVTIKSKECRFLDGSRLLDGSRKLNSIYRKEMVL